MTSDDRVLREVLQDLAKAGFDVGVFGGWAEDLLEVIPPRPHGDVDILVVNPGLDEIDAFVTNHNEIVAKRNPHKRAYLQAGVMVELFLVTYRGGRWTTNFWGSHEHQWPTLSWVYRRGLPVAPLASVQSYRDSYAEIHPDRKHP
jgi:hypothetical protein